MTTSLFPVPQTGGMTLLADVTTALNATTATISSIPQNYKELQLQIWFTGSVGGPSTTSLTVNGNTSNYSWGYPTYYSGNGSGSVTPTYNYGHNQSALILPGITNGSTFVRIPDYTGSQAKNMQFFNFTSYMSSTTNNGAGIFNSGVTNGPITSLGFTFSNVSGTTYRIRLWGVN